MKLVTTCLASFLALGCLPACSSGYKTQEYARLSNARDFEYEFPVVWKATVTALSDYKLEEKDAQSGRIMTDWIYSTSNDKYVEYQANGFPRKHYLQARYKFLIEVKKQVGKIRVQISPREEIENLRSDGTFDSWKAVSDFDAGRVNELLDGINRQILTAPGAI